MGKNGSGDTLLEIMLQKNHLDPGKEGEYHKTVHHYVGNGKAGNLPINGVQAIPSRVGYGKSGRAPSFVSIKGEQKNQHYQKSQGVPSFFRDQRTVDRYGACSETSLTFAITESVKWAEGDSVPIFLSVSFRNASNSSSLFFFIGPYYFRFQVPF